MFERAQELGASPADGEHVVSVLMAAFLMCFKSGRLELLQLWAVQALRLARHLPPETQKLAGARLEPLVCRLLESAGEKAKDCQLFSVLTSLSNVGCFKVGKIQMFSRGSCSMATDGAYLYIVRANLNGGMFKVGTGRRGTEMGRIYLERQSEKVDDMSWVYLRGKLYLRMSNRENGSLEVYSCETLQLEDWIQLYSPIMNLNNVQNLNKNNPILSDGQYLYMIGKYIKIEKQVGPPRPIEEEAKKDKLKKKTDKKTEPDGQVRILEFILHEYDTNNSLMGDGPE